MAISLSSISRSGAPKPPVIVVHGAPGIGKTTFAANSPAPVFMPLEDGMGTLQVASFPILKEWHEVMEAITALYQDKHEYQTVVIDSLSALEPIIWRQVARDANKTNLEDLGYGKGYVMALDYWHQLMSGIIALRDHRGMTPILIAHSEITRYDSPEVEPFDRFGIKLHKRAFQLLYERADVIGFANWRTMIVKDDVGFNKKQARGIGTGERLLHLIEKPAYIAKNRYGLPETIELNWSAFSAAMSAAFPAPASSAASSKKAA